jgi:two-component system response regulator PilR (NtrC family)
MAPAQAAEFFGAMSMRILVVDDNLEIVEELCHTLRRRGHEVVTAASVGEAMVALATGGSFEAVITDMRLPEGSGAEVLRVASRLHPSSARYLMSGEASTQEITEARREGVEAIFWKPVSLRTVVETMHERHKATAPRDRLDF